MKHYRRNAGLYSLVFTLSTVSVFVGIGAAAKVSYESNISDTVRYYTNIGLILNAIGWLFIVLALIMFTIPRKGGRRQTTGGAFWLFVAMALTIAGSALFLTAAVDLNDQSIIYQLQLSAGIIGIIAGASLLLHGWYAWRVARHAMAGLIRMSPRKSSTRRRSTRRRSTRRY